MTVADDISHMALAASVDLLTALFHATAGAIPGVTVARCAQNLRRLADAATHLAAEAAVPATGGVYRAA